MKGIKANEYWIKLYEQVDAAVKDFVVLFDFFKDDDATEEETKAAYTAALEMSSLFNERP